MRRRKRKTDWLFADSIIGTFTSEIGSQTDFFTFPILPSQYVDQDAEGGCTVVRIVGNFIISAKAAAEAPFTNDFQAASFSLYRSQVDDTGAVPNQEVAPFQVPGLGNTNIVGGARSFLYSRSYWWQGTAITGVPFTGPFNFPFVSNGFPELDIRAKRRMKTGETILCNINMRQDGGAIWQLHFELSYRVLVQLAAR